MRKKIFLLAGLIFFVSTDFSLAQGSGMFSISGGPILGWHVPQINDLNDELIKIGFPEISSSGQFVVGGGGYIDVPVIKGLRIGGMGLGFSADNTIEALNIVKAVSLKYRMGGVSFEYVKRISKKFDYSIGSIFGIGSLGFSISKYPKEFQNWNLVNFGIDTVGNNNVVNKDYSKTLYIFQPQLGLGYQLTNFLYFKLNAGYVFTLSKNWKLDEILEVNNVPSGIKADGFSVSLGINVGLFVN
ncbi:MAG: hypothetical protein JW917_06710 [Ignavibacteria bacterium]|nr:hypothetical protein [Ignavibacteria bacterium]